MHIFEHMGLLHKFFVLFLWPGAARASGFARQVSLQLSEGAGGQGLGQSPPNMGCSPMLPKQGQRSRSGDSEQGQLGVQWTPDKSMGMRQVQSQAGKPSQGVRVAKLHWQVQAYLQGDSDKEEQGPEMRLLPALSPAALCMDPSPHAHGWGGSGEVAEPGGALRAMKIMEKCRVVSNCQWWPITKPVEIVLLSSPLSFRSGLACTLARCWGFLVTAVKQLLLPIV